MGVRTPSNMTLNLTNIICNRVHPKWLYHFLWSRHGQDEILSRRSGIAFADKRGQTHIYPKNVRDIQVPVPDVRIQARAVNHLDSVLSASRQIQDIVSRQKELLDKLEQAILAQAFRGEL